MKQYDAIICGAGFAGLALAAALEGDILLIDRKSIGSLPVSACATARSMLTAMRLESTIVSDIDTLRLHVGAREFEFELEPTWCTFDYANFCRDLHERFSGEFVLANVRGLEGSTVKTSTGDFSSECIIDCTGWRARLASSVDPNYFDKRWLGFGLEAVAEYDCDCFHFFHDDEIINRGIAWIFPAGGYARIGVGSYAGERQIKAELTGFLDRLGARAVSYHGGVIPWHLRDPVCGRIFVVGDAAGMVFAVLGEGIRQSIFFAQECARRLQPVIDGSATLDSALADYRRFVLNNRRWFDFFAWGQRWMTDAKIPKIGRLAAILNMRPIAKRMQKRFGETYSYE